MKFDMLCSIILEGKKDRQLAKISVVNPTPSFSMEDILRDPNDPSKGVRTYLDEKNAGDTEDPEDTERQARRALRRLNWVAKTAIKRIGRREVDIHKLHFNIIMIIEQYLTNVLRYDTEKIDSMQLKIAKEAAFIGNLLLPTSKRYPVAKGVFAVSSYSDNGVPVTEPIKNRKIDKNGLTLSDRIAKEFNMTVDEYIAAFDPDLLGTIKEIIRNGTITKDDTEDAVEDTTEDITEIEDTAESEITKESTDDENNTEEFAEDESEYESEVESESEEEPTTEEETEETGEAVEGVSVEDILKDPRIKNVYDSRIVRKVIKGMLSLGSVITDDQGKLILPEPGQEAWRSDFEGWKDAKDMEAIEGLPDDTEIGQTFGEEEPVDAELTGIEDEEDQSGISTEDEVAAARLGYRKPKRTEESDEENKDSDDEDK